MKIQSLVRKRLLVFCTTLFIVVVLTISSTFALKNNDISKTEIQENTNKISLKYLDDGTYMKTGSYPMTKDYGLETAPTNKLQIHNKDREDSNYSLMLVPRKDLKDSISVDKIYYSVNGEEPRILGDSMDYVIHRGEIGGNKKKNISIQIWVSAERVDNEDQNKTLNLDFKVLNY